MLHIDQNSRCEYSSSNFFYSSSNQLLIPKNLCSSFYNTFRMKQFKFFPLIPLVCQSNVMHMSCEWLNVQEEFECHTNGLRETLF